MEGEHDSSDLDSFLDKENLTVGAAHPGLKVFHINNALTHFNKESILKEELCEDEVELYLDNKHIMFAVEQIVLESDTGLESLFRLMSILPEPAASRCKRLMDIDNFTWKIHLFSVITVMLNWGATLENLDLEEILNMPANPFTAILPSPNSQDVSNKNTCPASSNIVLVLDTISERLPNVSIMSSSERAKLVQVLVYAALDHNHRRYLVNYCRTVAAVLDSYSSWGPNEAKEVLTFLKLDILGLQNAVFVCCSLFNMTHSRMNLVGTLILHKLLNVEFGLPADSSFPELVDQLPTHSELLTKFQLWRVYILTCLLHSLLVRSATQSPPCPQEAILKLHVWVGSVRGALTQYPYSYSVSSSHVRERLSRLTADCSAYMRSLYNTSLSKSMIIDSNIYA